MRHLLLLPLALSLVACGAPTRTAARDEMAGKVCDYYERCNELGTDKTYANREACMVDQRAFWDRTWTVGKCEDRINGDALQQCTARVEIAQCGAGGLIDLLGIFTNCGTGQVCTGG